MKARIPITLLIALLVCFAGYAGLFIAPTEAKQGDVQRIFYFHVASWVAMFTAFSITVVANIGWLATRKPRWDWLAVASAEAGVVCCTIGLTTGPFWAKPIWGIWWTWDPRLTSFFVCWLIYVGYFMLRRAIDDPTARARLSAVLSIFACVDIVLVWKSIEWFRTQHPGPVLEIRGGGGMAPGMEAPLWWNLLALLLLASALVIIRMRQESMQREIDSLRRYAHAF
jgi:heme exporter protein C